MALMLVIAALLLGNVVLPQAAHQPPGAPPVPVGVLGLEDMPRSPVFIGALGLFFINLLCVLGARVPLTIRRIRFRPPTAQRLRAWSDKGGGLTAPRPQGWDDDAAETLLSRLGYRVTRPGPSALWGLKHRAAALGFLIFHGSFIVMGLGGVLLYYTRSVGVFAIAEGQTFSGPYRAVVRRAPVGEQAPPRLTLLRVDPELAGGKPLQLTAHLRRQTASGSVEEKTSINHPATWGNSTLLVESAGVAPELWLQDARGYSLDRVVVLATSSSGDRPARVPLAKGALEAIVRPPKLGPGFPTRDRLPSARVDLTVNRRGEQLYAGTLGIGQTVRVGSAHLRLAGLRYWARFRLVNEQGGGPLVAGFILGVVGLLWRMLWFRREVAIIWDQDSVRFLGRGDYFPRKIQEELTILRELLIGETGQR